MKSVLKGAAGALAVMAVALSAKGDVIIHGGCNILVWKSSEYFIIATRDEK